MRFSRSVSIPSCLLLCIVALVSLQYPRAFTQGQKSAAGQDTSQPKRKLKFSHSIPAAVKILDIRRYEDDDWYEKIEFEVENVGEKPIYYLLIWLILREVDPGGVPVAFQLEYGESRLVSFYESLRDYDKPIIPGDKVVLTLSARQRRGATELKQTGVTLDVKVIEVSVNVINFGDGTGYIGGVKAIPKKRSQSLRIPTADEKKESYGTSGIPSAEY